MMFFPFLFVALFWIALFGGGGYLVLRLVRAYERRALGAGDGPLAERVRTLEDALQRMESEFEQLAEAQRFTTRLLTERAGTSAAPSAPAGDAGDAGSGPARLADGATEP